MDKAKLKRYIAIALIAVVALALLKLDAQRGGTISSVVISVLEQIVGTSEGGDPGTDINLIEDPGTVTDPVSETDPTVQLDEHGTYDSKEDVSLYIHIYGHLPENYITKKEAEDLGWTGGSVEKYAPGKCIGGMKFGNHEGLLPKKSGRQYYECDIDTLGRSSRGAKRIIYSNDGLIYYTSDHYESFELLYGEP